MKTAEEICEALRGVILNRQRVIVLLRHTERATEAADRFRAYLTEDKRATLLKPPGTNPDFVKLSNGAWVFFIGCEELGPNEDVGQADFVFWPTEGGDYAQVKHREWRLARSAQDTPWRPLEVNPDDAPRSEGTVWKRLAGEDDIG